MAFQGVGGFYSEGVAMLFGWAGSAKVAARVLACVAVAAVVLGACAWGQDSRKPQIRVTVQKTTGEVVRPHLRLEDADPAPSEDLQKMPPISVQRPIAYHNTETNEIVYSGGAPGRYTFSWYEGVDGLVSAMPPLTVDVKSEGPPIVVVFKVQDGGVIAGRVTDVAGHLPAAGVCVNATNVTGKESTLSDTTDADGRYRILGAIEGTYKVSVMTSVETGYLALADAYERQAATAPGKTAEGIDFVMRKVPLIRGRAVDKDGNPVVGAVSAIATVPRRQERRASNATERDGSFVLSGLEPAEGVYVGFESLKEGRGLCAVPIGPFTLTEQGLDGLVVVAQEAGQVSGVVVDSLGNPLPDAMVTLYSIAHKGWGYSVQSDALGVFVFKGVYAGEFRASAIVVSREEGSGLGFETEAPVACTVRPGAQVTGLKLTVPRDTGFIAGTVRDAAGKPIEGAALSVLRPHQDCVLGEPAKFTTDQEGRYRITGLAAGDWQVVVRDAAERYRPTSRTPVAVGSTDVDFTLHEAYFVEGRVISVETGQALPEFQVSLITRRYEEPLDGYLGGVPFKDAEGRFKLLMDFEGTTDITLVAYGPGYAAEKTFVSAVSPDKALTDVVVKLHRAGIVRGTVFDPDGKPKPEVKILRGEYTVVHDWDLYHLAAESGQDGTFEAKDLTPGPQKLTVYCPGFAPVCIDVAPESGGTQAVEVHLFRGAVLEGDLSIGGKPVDKETFVSLRVDYTAEMKHRSSDFADHGKPHYSFDHPVAPGHVWVTADFNQKNNSVGVVRREVTLKDGVPAKVDLDLPVGMCSIEGSVAAPEGVKNFRLELTMHIQDGTAGTTRWGEAGAFKFEDLPAGSGEVTIRAWLPDKSELVRTVPVELVAGTPCRLDVDLR